jgi:hypothetical protein
VRTSGLAMMPTGRRSPRTALRGDCPGPVIKAGIDRPNWTTGDDIAIVAASRATFKETLRDDLPENGLHLPLRRARSEYWCPTPMADMSAEEPETLRRSIAMLSPQAPSGLSRERGLAILGPALGRAW